jgi:antitoxin component YwqK of YwqJK toxin-antitoxin module
MDKKKNMKSTTLTKNMDYIKLGIQKETSGLNAHTKMENIMAYVNNGIQVEQFGLLKPSKNITPLGQELNSNINNMQTKKIKRWWINGNIADECTYINGQIHGLYKCWNKNGNKDIECTFQNGKKFGLYKSWWSDGKVCYINTQKKDQRFGTMIEFKK